LFSSSARSEQVYNLDSHSLSPKSGENLSQCSEVRSWWCKIHFMGKSIFIITVYCGSSTLCPNTRDSELHKVKKLS
jgi:hypothetical protein